MSGHSKWSTIKRKKGEKDGARAKVFTKISREIIVAIKEGGGDPNNNAKLATLIQKAKSNNIPNDNIDRLIKKAVGGGEKNDYENCVYEGYGPNGVAVIVDCLTDNRNRTAGEIRHYFDKFGGNFSFEDGCVEITTDPKEVENVANALRDMGYTVVSAEAEQVPSTYTTLTDEEQIKKMGLLLETLEDNDDVQNVWHNWDMD